MTSLQIRDESELAGVVTAVLDTLAEHQGDRAQVVALHGDLGAGKTTFVQYLATTLEVVEPVTSPTFVIMKGYEATHEHYDHLVHIDAYRIDDPHELSVLRFKEVLQQPRTLVCVEWAEKVETLLPADTLHVRFMSMDESRMITIAYGETN